MWRMGVKPTGVTASSVKGGTGLGERLDHGSTRCVGDIAAVVTQTGRVGWRVYTRQWPRGGSHDRCVLDIQAEGAVRVYTRRRYSSGTVDSFTCTG